MWISFSFASFLGGAPELLFVGIIHICMGLIGFIYASVSEKSQRMGDVMAGTIVIKDKSSVRYSLKDVLAIKNQENYYEKKNEMVINIKCNIVFFLVSMQAIIQFLLIQLKLN